MSKNRPVKTGTPAEVAKAMEAALDEVAAQIVSMPIRELVEEAVAGQLRRPRVDCRAKRLGKGMTLLPLPQNVR